MNLLRTRTPRVAGAALLAAAALAGGLPSVAAAGPAGPADPGDRRVSVLFKNHTNVRLTLSDSDVSEGDWTRRPPRFIKAYKVIRMGSESTEPMGGTEAEATYRTPYGDVDIYWSDPWLQDNEFTCDPPPELRCETDGDLSSTPRVKIDLYRD
jgi:hypothetical protein